jgi:hypothetical protein
VGPINGYRDNKMNSSHTDGESAALLPEENHGAKAAAAASPDSPSDYEEKTEVISGEENVVKWALRILSTMTKTLDFVVIAMVPQSYY